MIRRDFEPLLLSYAQFPVVGVFGPRQSGKTTITRSVFPQHTYVSLEDPEPRLFAAQDPRAFLRAHENEYGIIIDEFQYVPELLSYIQLAVDDRHRPGYFVLTGSQNFLMNEAVTQSLAGRIGILTLLPLSVHELQENKIIQASCNETMYTGCYPRMYAEHIDPEKRYPSYIQTYIERDVRQLVNVRDLHTFQIFLKLCAGRIGQLLNLSDLATVCGVSVTTARRWISLLEASYVLFLLQPYYKNFNKRLTKSPKLYFYDTGLACSLLGIDDARALPTSPFRGPLFESFVIADLCKQYYNIGKRPPLYFWRDLNGRVEVDCIVEQAEKVVAIEIKAGETFNARYFDGLERWREIAGDASAGECVIYAGEAVHKRTAGQVYGWQAVGTLASRLRGG